MNSSDLNMIRGLKSWKLVTIGLSVFIYNGLILIAVIMLQAAEPDLPLMPLIIGQFILAVVLVLMNLGCVLALMPYTSEFTGVSSGRPSPRQFTRLLTAAAQDLGAALWPRWLRRTRQ
jgi:hypothetical protein